MKIKVCVGETCHLQGAEDVVKTFKQFISDKDAATDSDDIQLSGCFCMNNCRQKHVSVLVDGEKYSVRPKETEAFFARQIKTKG